MNLQFHLYGQMVWLVGSPWFWMLPAREPTRLDTNHVGALTTSYLLRKTDRMCLDIRICEALWKHLEKGQCHELLNFRFFSLISVPQAPEYPTRAVSYFFKMRGDIRSSIRKVLNI